MLTRDDSQSLAVAWRSGLAPAGSRIGPGGLPVALLLALLLTGCGLFSRSSLDDYPPRAAKILIRYQWTEFDGQKPAMAFHVFRSSTAEGPFSQVTSEPIRAGKHQVGETFVVHKDVGVEMGQTYYYYLERVAPTGERMKWTSVTRATALLPLEAADRPEYRLWQEAQRKARRGLDS